MSDMKFYVDINLQDTEIVKLKAETLDITTNLASANAKRIVYWANDYYYSDGTDWILMANVIPTGGTTGQVLSKIDGTNYNTQWITPTSGGSTDQLIFQAKYNQAGGILKGQAVYVNGADGTNITVGKADYSSEATSSKTLGLAIEDGANNHIGAVISDGLLSGIDTSGANAAGDPVWLGDDGNLIYGLVNKPYAPNHLVFIGIVTKKNPSTGEIFVKVQNGFELKEIHDVDLISTAPTNEQVLTYESSTQLWKNKDLPSVVGGTIALNLSPVLDNTITDPSTITDVAFNDVYLIPAGASGAWAGQDNNLATWDGEQWIYYTPVLNDTTTVLTGSNAGNVYEFDGSVWVLTISTSPGVTPFYIAGSGVDAGANKTSSIARAGSVVLGSNSGPVYAGTPLTVKGNANVESINTRYGLGLATGTTLNNWYLINQFSVNWGTSKNFQVLVNVSGKQPNVYISAVLHITLSKNSPSASSGTASCRVVNVSGPGTNAFVGTNNFRLDETNFEFRRYSYQSLGPAFYRLYYKPTVQNTSVTFTVLNNNNSGTTSAVGIIWYNRYLGASIEVPGAGGLTTNFATFNYAGQRTNISAITDPTVTDDYLQEYTIGSLWYNTVTQKVFQCLDNSSSAAVWKQITNDISFIPVIEQSEIRRGAIAISGSTSTGSIGGITPALTGSAVAITFGGTVPLPKLRLLTVTAATNATVGIITGSSNVIYRVGRGFRFIGSYIYSDQSSGGTNWYSIGARQFCGLVAGTSLLPISSTNTVETRTNLIGIGSDSADTNLQIFHNDASGNCTKINLGANFPANKTGAVANGEAYQLELYNAFGSTDVKYRVRRLSDGLEVTGVINSNIPTSATDLGPQIVRTSGSSSENVSIDLIQLTTYTRE